MSFDQALSERYEIIRQLGSGGQGTVLQARDREHDNRYVALKIYELTPDLTREDLSGETDVLLSLTQHPGLPHVRTDFFLDDRYVIVMDWIDGSNLQDRIVRHGDPGLPLAMVIDYISQAADALQHLHSHSPPVFHGDVKPANLVLTKGGQIVLVDFGIAAEGMPRRTAGAAGTRGYRAPEVAAGEPLSVAADVYGLAATAYALLTGAPPLGAQADLEGLDTDEAKAVARTLRRALSTDPDARPESAREFAERLKGSRFPALPAGVVTFLATELADANRLWEEHGNDMRTVCEQLDDLVCDVVERASGRVMKSMGEGESTFSVFTEPSAATATAFTLHERVDAASWLAGIEPRLRIALITGEADQRNGVYVGETVARAVRLRGLAQGGTTIVSSTTAQLVARRLPGGTQLVDLGDRALDGFTHAEHVFALTPGVDVPPLPNPPRPDPPRPDPPRSDAPESWAAGNAPVHTESSPPPMPMPREPAARRLPRTIALPGRRNSRQTADAVMAPSAIVLGSAAAGVAIVAGVAFPIVIIAGAGVWAARVGTLLPRGGSRVRIDAEVLTEPWRSEVINAMDAQDRYTRLVRTATAGPLRERLREIGGGIDRSVLECWRVAQRGNSISKQVTPADLEASRREVEQAEADARANPSDRLRQTAAALQARLDADERTAAGASGTLADLRLLNAWLDEAVARAVELANRADALGDLGSLGGDVDDIVTELTNLRSALDDASGQTQDVASGGASIGDLGLAGGDALHDEAREHGRGNDQ